MNDRYATHTRQFYNLTFPAGPVGSQGFGSNWKKGLHDEYRVHMRHRGARMSMLGR
jgi:hypothetical protein